MRSSAAAERTQVVAAFEGADDSPSRMLIGYFHQPLGDVGVIGFNQSHLAESVLAVRVEAGRDENHLRLEFVEPRQPHFVDHLPCYTALRSRWKRHVHHVFRKVAGAAVRIKRMLEKAGHQHLLVVRKNLLGSIAMMHIEIDDRDTLETERVRCVACADSDAVEDAKPHRGRFARMVPRRTHRAKRIGDLTIGHAVGRVDHRTCRAQRRIQRVRVHRRIGIERPITLRRYARLQACNVIGAVRALQRLSRRQRRIEMLQMRRDARRDQMIRNCGEPLGAFRVPRSHLVLRTIPMREQTRLQHSLSPGPNGTMLEKFRATATQIGQIIVGKTLQIRQSLTCLLAGGHLLIEDAPGVGKTTMAHAIAISMGLPFRRIQFTSDLLPSDVIGVSVYERNGGQFVFHPGPIFTEVLLADEINRASPKTQSALLEAMEESQVSVDGLSRPLPNPFFVIATQNPLHQVGTFPLPESQLDRFLMCISLGYPDRAAERSLLSGEARRDMLKSLDATARPADLLAAQAEAKKVYVSAALLDYVQSLIAHTRASGKYAEGLSPAVAWHCSQQHARGRGSTVANT